MLTQQQIIALAVEAGLAEVTDTAESLPVDYVESMAKFARLAAQQERNTCLAEIETGIWMDRTTEEVLAEIAEAIRARGEACRLCKGTGERDSGGSQPWGAAIMVECECQQSDCVAVPIEPTRAMLDAARTDLVRDGEIDPMLKGIWNAMVSASQC